MIFEIRDLKFATPATATRAGILYISEGRQWSNMVSSWLDRVAKPYAERAKWKVWRCPLVRCRLGRPGPRAIQHKGLANPPRNSHPQQDPAVPVKWLSELFDKYVPACIEEMAREYSHITPLGQWAGGARGLGEGQGAPSSLGHSPGSASTTVPYLILNLGSETNP
jgi:dynein heavy chain